MSPEFAALLDTAVRAPSGDNTQPWRFEVEPDDGVIAFAVDETRDPSPMNAGQRMARIALGAAVENLLRAADARGWEARPEPPDDAGRVRVRLARNGEPQGDAETVIRERVTNRRVYDGRPVPPEVLADLAQSTPPLDWTATHWVTGADRLKPLADVIGRADMAMFGEPTMRRAFLSKVRLDLPPDATAEDGLPLAALEVSGMDRVALRMMPRMPNWLLKYSGGLKVFVKKARQLVASAAGLCVVTARDATPAADILVGRVMQRAWLLLNERGLAVQPMMSLPVLENVLENGDSMVATAVGRDTVMNLGREFRALVPELGDSRPAWLMRFGYAPPPSGRTGRLPPAVTVREPAPTPATG